MKKKFLTNSKLVKHATSIDLWHSVNREATNGWKAVGEPRTYKTLGGREEHSQVMAKYLKVGK